MNKQPVPSENSSPIHASAYSGESGKKRLIYEFLEKKQKKNKLEGNRIKEFYWQKNFVIVIDYVKINFHITQNFLLHFFEINSVSQDVALNTKQENLNKLIKFLSEKKTERFTHYYYSKKNLLILFTSQS